MREWVVRFSIVLMCGFVTASAPAADPPKESPPAPAPEISLPVAAAEPEPPETKAPFDSAKALAGLRKSIAGHENDPAEKVFKNIVSMQGVPAGRLLAIMEIGMSRSLGVGCNHCHQPGKWDVDTEKKKITREMSKMTREINTRVHTIDGIGDDAAVNCTTCHRGQVKPALDLAPAASH